jgi:arginine decarboxylase
MERIESKMSEWDIQQARDTYNTAHWGGGYFDIGPDGTLLAYPDRDAAKPGIDLARLADEAREAGLTLPVLVRFVDILHDRVNTLCDAFAKAIRADEYQGKYTVVYPIKVNQQRRVVEEIVRHSDGRVGLEAGSKPELMAVLAMTPVGGTVICNGYKDREYIRLALRGIQLGLKVHIVIEKTSEVDDIIAEAAALKVTPLLGVRVRLASIGAGKWQNTGGEKSKFGLTASQTLEVIDRLKANGLGDSLKLLHFHLGSQIPHIRDIQRGMREAARYYAEFRRLGLPVEIVDVGGGLGVDYEGTRSRSYCSMNYSVAEYAHTVVHTLWEICREHDLLHPDIISESGRALTAHHAMLITNVIDVDRVPDAESAQAPAADDPLILHDLWQNLQQLNGRSAVESYHDAYHWLTEAQTMYTHGILTLEQRASAERIYQATCRKIFGRLDPRQRAHRELLDELNEKLADKLFCNFSIFQSMPDIWAIQQIFPVLPLTRLDEEPSRRNVLQDLTCDSDGTISHYVDRDGVESTLPLPPYRDDEEYLLGVFMIGAYQEILGDMHNLFGDTDSVNVELTEDGYVLSDPLGGDTVESVLRYVHFDMEDLMNEYRARVAAAAMSEQERAATLSELDAGLRGYTYLED